MYFTNLFVIIFGCPEGLFFKGLGVQIMPRHLAG